MAADNPRLSSAIADRYRIERELGQGGMATVYLAHDVRHDRKVALKVLRPELSAILGAERFLAEIKTTANLQHPHILSLFDSGEAGGQVYYVMPFVDGESLRDRLNREHQLPVGDAVRIAKEVADALHYAHQHGIVHRDIKPENILLHGGHAQVADFGIALAASRVEGGSRMTETGMSLGTPAYMSPEQAMGDREITPRADVYALGCVLYEMLTGEPPFTGPTPQAIVARVMTESPRSLTLQRHTVPPQVDAAIARALEKLPADRFTSAAQFAEALDTGPSMRTGAYERLTADRGAVPRFKPSVLPFVAAILMLALGLLLGGKLKTAPQGQLRLSMTLPSESPPLAIRLSPDARTMAFSAAGAGDIVSLYVRGLDDFAARRLEGTEGAQSIAFSPDGRWITFVTFTLQVRRVAVTGGAPIPVNVRGSNGVITLEYAGPDSYVVTLPSGSLATMTADGAVHEFARPDSTVPQYQLEQVLPGGNVLALAWVTPPTGPLLSFDPKTGKADTVIDTPVSWAHFSDGTLAWSVADGSIFAAQFNPRSGKTTGPAVPVRASVLSVLGSPPAATFENGVLAFAPSLPRALVRVDRQGFARPIMATDRTYHSPRLSPDGRRIAMDFTDQERDTWVFDLADSTLTRFGFDSIAHDPMWTPDGRSIVFAAFRGGNVGIFRRALSGGPRPESILVNGLQLTMHAITPDGREGVAARLGDNAAFDLVRVPLDGNGKMDSLVATRYNEQYPALSPDGRWLAYSSDESGRNEVYVRAYPSMTDKTLVSQDGGTEPMWSRDGREIFFRSGGTSEPRLVAAAVETRPAFRVARRTALFNVASYEFANPHSDYDVFPDGRSFLMVRQGRAGQAAEIKVVQGVRALVRAGSR